nr:mutS protein 5 [Hymenolepis microstoma]
MGHAPYYNLKGYDACIQRLHLIKLPYAPTFVDEGENAAYIMSILPKDSPQMIRAAGALLDYLAKRTSPVENFPFPSVENVLDIQLYLRYKPSDFEERVLSKMHTSSASPNDWKILLQTLQSLKEILSICHPHPELGLPFETPESVQSPQQVITSLLDKVSETIDMSSTSNHKRFIVRQGHHAWLDEWKQIYRCLPDILSRLAEHELNRLRGHVDACGLIYFPLVGYLLQIPSSQVSEELQELGLQYMFTNGTLTYYRTETTKELDKRYGDVMYAILDAETSIMHELQEEILKTSKPLLKILDYATELDCICALATAAIKMNGVRPRFMEGNVIKIKKGRHILFETLHPNYKTNSFVSPTDKGNITLITGPNASGKTMYIKQVGLIVYLAHIGSFVPADYAAISPVDKILAQMPADINQQKDQEPIAEASWLAMVLRHTTKNSLLLLDEFPYINDRNGRKAMFLGLLEHLSRKESPTVLITGLNAKEAHKESSRNES